MKGHDEKLSGAVLEILDGMNVRAVRSPNFGVIDGANEGDGGGRIGAKCFKFSGVSRRVEKYDRE